MAAVGATIVLSGLAILSFIISQLHRILALMEKKPEAIAIIAEPEDQEEAPDPISPSLCPANPDGTLELYRPLIEELDEQFKLMDLYSLADRYHLPHPHLSIRCLRETGRLQSLGDGVFQLVS